MDSNKHKSSILKTTRESKGLSLEIVHESTKIPLDALKAIEEGYSVRILSPFYYRGFIKIYAEFLNLDLQEVFKHYGLDQASKPVVALKAPLVKRPRAEAKPNVWVEQFQEWLRLVLRPQTFFLILKIAVVLLLCWGLFKTAGCINSMIHKKHALVRRKVVFVEAQHKVVTPPSKPVVVPVKPEVVDVDNAQDKVDVAVRAIKDTWLRVKADDKVVFEMTLQKGSMESWTADKRIELSGRDLEQLDMEVNNKPIGSLGGGQRRIRKVIITPQGLTVKK